MLRKTELKIDKDLDKESQIFNMCCNISAALEEIENYQIAYITSFELSVKDREKGLEMIEESLLEIVDFIDQYKVEKDKK